MSAVAVVPARWHGMLPVLDENMAAAFVTAVDDAVAHWTRRQMFPLDFYTLGAASYIDAVADVEDYVARAAALNPLLQERFAALYDAVFAALGPVFGPCALHDPLAYPGFHVFGHRPGHANNLVTLRAMEDLSASIHSDRQFEPHTAVWSRFTAVDLQNTMTFTLALELPSRGGGLCFWGEPALSCYDDDGEYARFVRTEVDFRGKKGVEPPSVIPYRVGSLFYFLGLGRHVIAPSWALSTTDRRITLQGHGVRADGIWRLYF
jgi:hypothetical protein